MEFENKSVLIVDAGNTRIKAAHFFEGQIIDIKRFKINQAEEFRSYAHKINPKNIFVSSVLQVEALTNFLGESQNVIHFKHDLKLPVHIKYQTPETLGLDRLANAAAMQSLYPTGCKLAIDLGTCIKFDFVDEHGNYLGGSISPGLNMRYAALHEFTGKLPFLHFEEQKSYLGFNSSQSIHAGVIHGIQGELNHFISSYLQDYQGLTFFVTGGDAKFFDFPRKSNIFADENLTLTGLYKIYLLNA
jgi:type III pantothenate kinase